MCEHKDRCNCESRSSSSMSSSSSRQNRTTPFEQDAAVLQNDDDDEDDASARLVAVVSNNANSNSDSSSNVPSNETLLGTAFISFMSFALTQLVFAFIAGSEAMMGDSAAMIVDAFTYLFNWIAERKKKQFDRLHATTLDSGGTTRNTVDAQKTARNKRKMVLQLEIVPPILSVTTLLVVTAFVTQKALRVLYKDLHGGEQRLPNVNLMLGFSIFNLLLDGLNVFCFARAKHLMGYAVTDDDDEDDIMFDDHQHGHQHDRMIQADTENGRPRSDSSPSRKNKNGYTSVQLEGANDCSIPYTDLEPPQQSIPHNDDCANDDEEAPVVNASFDSSNNSHDNDRHNANLNMCSAYTHVFADTLRSIAVILAACTAELIDEVTAEEADATAAVVVSVLILLSLAPLMQGLVKSVAELRAIWAEEESELLMFAENGSSNAPQQQAISTSCSFELT